METSEITDCVNKLIGTIKLLEGHIDALQTENTLLESENESLKSELLKATTNNSCNRTSSSFANISLMRNNLIVSVAPYVLEKTEPGSHSSNQALSEEHLKRAAINIYKVVDCILNVSRPY